MITTPSTVQMELARVYRRELNRFYEFDAAVVQIVAEDFPNEDASPERITRWHIDALRGMTNQLSAMVEGYQRAGG